MATSSLPPSSSFVEAVASAPPGATTTGLTATGIALAPSCEPVQATKAIGEAKVDTTFLQQLQPNMQGLSTSFQQINQAVADKAAAESQAATVLLQAGALMAEAMAKQAEIDRAKIDATAALVSQQAGMKAQMDVIKTEKAAESAHSQVGAEIEARAAAKAKAEEAASMEAARLAAAEAAEADAMMKVALAKKQQAIEAQRELVAAAGEARTDAAAATQRAATLTAQAEARAREMKLAENHLAATTQALSAVTGQIDGFAAAPAAPVAAVAVVAPAAAGAGTDIVPPSATKLDATSTKFESASIEKREVPITEGWNQMQSLYSGATKPLGTEFPFTLQIRITHADFNNFASGSGFVLPKQVQLKVSCGSSLLMADHLLDTSSGSKWNVEGFLPIANPEDLVQFTFLDAASSVSTFPREIGKALIRIHTLVDGHISRDNALAFDGLGAKLFTTLHLEKWNGDSYDGRSGAAPWQWQSFDHSLAPESNRNWYGDSKPGNNYWQLSRRV